MNDDPEKIARLTKDGALTKAALQQVVSDQFADHNFGSKGVFVTQGSERPVLKTLVGTKKYNSDPLQSILQIVRTPLCV